MQKFKGSFVGVKRGEEKMEKRKVERKLILSVWLERGK